MHRGEDRTGEVDWDIPTLMREAQEATQRGDDQLGAGATEMLGMAQDEPIGILSNQLIELRDLSTKALGEKGVNLKTAVAAPGHHVLTSSCA